MGIPMPRFNLPISWAACARWLIGPWIDAWLRVHPGGVFTFCKRENEPFKAKDAAEAFRVSVDGSKWEVLHGWHALRHSFCSNCALKGLDQRIIDSWLMYDGMFFDNFFTDESWLTQDIHGNPVQIDADENGVADDPAVLDAAWRTGVFAVAKTRVRSGVSNSAITATS